MTALGWIVLAGFGMSAIALVGSTTLPMKKATLDRTIMPLVAFAAGSLLGGAFSSRDLAARVARLPGEGVKQREIVLVDRKDTMRELRFLAFPRLTGRLPIGAPVFGIFAIAYGGRSRGCTRLRLRTGASESLCVREGFQRVSDLAFLRPRARPLPSNR
jgi:hypothetical protein